MARKPKCLIEGCGKEAKQRGLCSTCLQVAYAHIRAGKTTEKKLIDAGLLLPSRRGQRPEGEPFRRAFAALK